MRLIADEHCTWSDLEHMTIDDVDDVWEAVGAVTDAAHESRRRAEERAGRRRR